MNNKLWPWIVAIIAVIVIFVITFSVVYLVKVIQYMDMVFNSIGVWLNA